MELSIAKVHGTGNDFFLIDQRTFENELSETELNTLSQKLCNRESGLLKGADGLLLIERSTQDDTSAKLRIINQDGSETSMCGNGLRSAARYLMETEGMEHLLIETMHADLKVCQSQDLAKNVKGFQVEISPVSFLAETIPMVIPDQETLIDSLIPELSKTIHFSVVAVPSPHLVAFVDEATMNSQEQERISLMVNQPNELFPKGINVSFAQVTADNQLFVKTFEKGVGFTDACGTAMCACSLLYTLLYQRPFVEYIRVETDGGLAKTVVHQDHDGNYWMELIGNATVTHLLTGNLKQLLTGNFHTVNVKETNEETAYQTFLASVNKKTS